MENSVTKREKISYGLYFMGQNVFYGLVGYMTTYFTDIGITAALVAIVALITKVWDAINDPILGMIMDKVNFKKGKFLPWLRISVIAIPVATILLFIIPTGISMMAKIIWATLAYMLWDTAYTLCDVPIFGIVTTMTIDQKERVSLNSIGRMFAIFAGIVTGIVLPLVRQRLGGWSTTVIVLSLLSCVMMIPICLFARERVIEKERVLNDGAEESYTLRDMVECLRRNKYLLLFFAAPLISSLLNVGANWGLYVARYCLGGEEAASYVSMAVIIPTLIGAFMAVELCKKYDGVCDFKCLRRNSAGNSSYTAVSVYAGLLRVWTVQDRIKNAWCNVCGADIFYKIKWSDRNSSQCVCVNFNRLPRGRRRCSGGRICR